VEILIYFARLCAATNSDKLSDLSYGTGLSSNAVLTKLAHEVVAQAKRAYARAGGKITRFHSTCYQAGTWSRSRRVVIQVEVSDHGVNTRFVVTD